MPDNVVITGVGVAVPGLTGPLDLLATPDGRAGAGFDPQTELAGRQMRHKDRASRLALKSVEYALLDAGLGDGELFTGPADTTAIVVSSNLGSLDSVCEFADVIAERSVLGLSPLGLPKTSSNVIAGAIAIQYRMRGPNLTLCNGVTGGLDAVYWGQVLLASGRAEVVVVVGVEPSSDVITKFVGAETVDGAAALVLERADHAAARQARQRARVVGYSRRSDPADAVGSASPDACEPFTLCLAATAYSASSEPPGHTVDLQSSLGECSGALGVLQAVAAVAHLDSGGAGPVVAVNAASNADAAAALVLGPADATTS